MKTRKIFLGCAILVAGIVTLGWSTPRVLAQSGQDKETGIDSALFRMTLHGAHCENIIHKRTPFEKGVVRVKADAQTQTVKVVFKTGKTDVKKLKEHFKKIGFDSEQLPSAAFGKTD